MKTRPSAQRGSGLVWRHRPPRALEAARVGQLAEGRRRKSKHTLHWGKIILVSRSSRRRTLESLPTETEEEWRCLWRRKGCATDLAQINDWMSGLTMEDAGVVATSGGTCDEIWEGEHADRREMN